MIGLDAKFAPHVLAQGAAASWQHRWEIIDMFRSALVVPFLAMLAASSVSLAEEISKEQIKGLDEQVQEIKSDVLGIATELSRLEEKLHYPSNTQVSLFVSLAPAGKFRLDSIEIQIDGKPVAHHLYSYQQLEALRQGGVQRVYTGNVKSGEHELLVTVLGKSAGDNEYRKTASFKLVKDVGPKLAAINVAGSGAGDQDISLKDW